MSVDITVHYYIRIFKKINFHPFVPIYGIMVVMTTISRDDVVRLAQLSSLQLGDDEVAALQTDIGNILNYIEQLSELDTAGAEPTYQVTGLENVWRGDDVAKSGVTREQLIALAPESAENQIKVPKVL